MRSHFLSTKLGFIATILILPQAFLLAHWSNKVEGVANTKGRNYACALISNGSISTQIDNLGVQKQTRYVSFYPCVAWEGRNYGVPHDTLISHGYFDTELSVNGKLQDTPLKWSQTLHKKEAFSENVVEYADAIVRTIAFVPAGHDMLVVKKIITARKPGQIKFAFNYKFAPKINAKPRERVQTLTRYASGNCASFEYIAFGHKTYRGIISIISDSPCNPSFLDADTASLLSQCEAVPGKAFEISYFITFNDDFERKDYRKSDLDARTYASKSGFDKIFADHKESWLKYWSNSYIDIPDKDIENTYYTGLYHQRCNATKWSLPVGIFSNSHWGGRFFGWDEAFNAMALASSGKFEYSRRPADFRSKNLDSAIMRVNKNGAKRKSGARFVWESMVDGFEGAPAGFWNDHIFHMSNVVMSAWEHFLYTNDKDFLKKNYELMVESALYYMRNSIYEREEGYIVGRCTDLERLGEAKLNPFMTSCGIIYTLEKTAAAAKILGVDSELAKECLDTAKGLRKTLPNDGKKYVPYEGSKDYSIGSVGGFYPYPVLDPQDKLARKAVYDFLDNIHLAGNMYDTGKSVNAWYAGWVSVPLVSLGDRTNPARLLASAAKNTGAFYDTYEINEPENNLQLHPWFSTGSGNFVYAVNQMLVQSKENGEVWVCPGTPKEWKDIEFKLPCYGGLFVEAKIKDSKLSSLKIESPSQANSREIKTVVIPESYVDTSKIAAEWVKRGGNILIRAEAGKPLYK